MANPQPTDAHLRISHKIIKEILRRNFTKQQKNILDLVLRLSWGCGKPSALIPKKKQFRLCGVSEKQIAAELRQLEQMKVLLIEESAGFYQIQKDYDQWQVTPVKGWSEVDFNDLVSINIKTTTPDLRDKLPDSGTSSLITGQTPRFFSRGNSPKTGSESPAKHYRMPLRRVSIKKDLYNKKSLQQQPPQPRTGVEKLLRRFGEEFKAAGVSFSQFDREEIETWLNDPRYRYSPDLIMRALKESVLHKKVNVPYIDSILRGWKAKGWNSPEQVDDGQQQGHKKNASQPDNVVRFPNHKPNPAQTAQDLINEALGRK